MAVRAKADRRQDFFFFVCFCCGFRDVKMGQLLVRVFHLLCVFFSWRFPRGAVLAERTVQMKGAEILRRTEIKHLFRLVSEQT